MAVAEICLETGYMARSKAAMKNKERTGRRDIMVYTVTLNPALDYIVAVTDFKLGVTNRTESEMMLPGGKGLNVSQVLNNLGIGSKAVGYIGGTIGQEIRRRAENLGIGTDFIELEQGMSRINIKLKSAEGTEINGQGPQVTQMEIEKLCQKLNELSEGDVLFLSGSIPPSVPSNIYLHIMEQLRNRGILFIVDAEGGLLTSTLSCHPFLIKPNHHELEGIFHVEIKSREDVVPYARKLQEMGAVNVLVSMGAQGAVLAAGDGSIIKAGAPKGKAVNTVGAGDSMAAGFMAGWLSEKNYEHAFYMGVAAGSASAFSEYLATKEEIYKEYRKLRDRKNGCSTI